MIPPFDYQIPRTLDEACDLLWKAGQKGKVIAGGTDLVIALRNGVQKPQVLIDITQIKELQRIHDQNGEVVIGAATTHSEIAHSSLVKKYGKPLSDASTLIGSTQIRNLGTIGGNIINASPAADTLPPLMVLDAIGRVVSKDGEREVPLFKLFKAPYETDLKPFEILTHVIFKKLPPDAKTVFVRLARREAMAIARISIAIVFRVNESKGFIQDIRISVGSATPTPQRMSIAEEVLKGRQPDEASLRLAARNLSGGMIQRTGTRLSTSYKVPVIEALFMRAFKNARDGFV